MKIKMDRFIQTIFEKMSEGLLVPEIAYTLIKEYEKNQKENQKKMETDEIAIIGLACRLSHSNSTQDFWENLKNGKNLIEDISENRFPTNLLSNRNLHLRGSFLSDIDTFDQDFFQLSEEEARVTDPQQRYVLEISWELMESSGYGSRTSRDHQSTGVFIGARGNTYKVGDQHSSRNMEELARSTLLGQAQNMLAARVSDFLDLKGPAMVIDTACSSSLVSVHLACQSLNNGECDMAIAGGVDLFINPEGFIYLKQMKALSPDGLCHTFDKKANGYVPGEGAVLLLLKPLKLAIKNRDHIYAIIKGSAINNDGFTVGVTTPSVEGQKRVIKNALKNAGVGAETITLIEAHGTGTFVGDPIEFKALTSVFREYTKRNNFCALGSVKTNIGHLHSAAGAAGLLKVCLALHNKKIPPSLNFEEANSRFNIISSPFYITDQSRTWECNGYPRRAGISSLGFGGTNCHMVVEEFTSESHSFASNSRDFYLFKLSANDTDAMAMLIAKYKEVFNKNDYSLSDICYTLHTGRESFSHRLAICCRNQTDLRNTLSRLSTDLSNSTPSEGFYFNRVTNESPPSMAWLFPDQGSQYPEMGIELYKTEPNFKKALDECDKLFTPLLKQSIIDCLYNLDSNSQSLDETIVIQPGVFAISYALAQMWLSWGISPSVMIGYSLGEFVAAVIAGVFSLQDAITVIFHRSRLMQNIKEKGGMAVGMEPVLDEFIDVLKRITFSPAKIPIVSNVTGDFEKTMDRDYWIQQIVNPIKFHQGVEKLRKEDYEIFLEVGPGTTLATIVKSIFANDKDALIFTTFNRQKTDWHAIWKTIAQLWVHGIAVDTQYIEKPFMSKRIPLPTYPFKKKHFWVEQGYLNALWGSAPRGREVFASCEGERPFLNDDDHIYLKRFDLSKETLIRDHIVFNKTIVPAVLLWELVRSTARKTYNQLNIHLSKVIHLRTLHLEKNSIISVRVLMKRDLSFQIEIGEKEQRILYTKGKIIFGSRSIGKVLNINHLKQRLPRHFTGEDIYKKLGSKGLNYGPLFRSLVEGWSGETEVLVKLELSDNNKNAYGEYLFHPVLLDGVIQGVMGIEEYYKNHHIYVPFYIDEITCSNSFPQFVFGYIQLRKKRDHIIVMDADITDPSGNALIQIKGLYLKILSRNSLDNDHPGNEIFSALTKHAFKKWPLCVNKYDMNRDILLGDKLDQLCSLYVFKILQKLKASKKQSFSLSESINSKGVLRKFEPLMKKMISILKKDQWVKESKNGEYRIYNSPKDNPDKIADSLKLEYSESSIFPKLLKHCLNNYIRVLTGERNPMQVLFPLGSSAMLAELYGLPSPHYDLVVEVLAEYIKIIPGGKKLRILEIGAGTGGLTSKILPKIKELHQEYYFTDISPVLLKQSEEKFDCDNVIFKVLDIEKDPEKQGFKGKSFDCIVAANVLHATSRLKNTLFNVKKLFMPEGLMILVETTLKNRFADLIFGLTNGWWKYKDTEYRKDSVLLSASEWEDVLLHEGFGSVKILAKNTSSARHPLSVMVAQFKKNRPRKTLGKEDSLNTVIDPFPKKIKDWFYIPQWKKEKLPQSKKTDTQVLIVLVNQNKLHEDIVLKLKLQGFITIEVYPGELFQILRDDKYILDTSNKKDCFELIEQLVKKHPTINGIVHLWACEEAKEQALNPETLFSIQHKDVLSFVFLIQALVKNITKPNFYVSVVATNVNWITGEESNIFPEKSILMGFIKTLPHEYRKINGFFLDVDINDFLKGYVGEQLISHLKIKPKNQIIGIRKGERYVKKITKAILPLTKNNRISLKNGGVYIIAGGLGGIGLEIAHFIARRVKAKIILINRSLFPNSIEWDNWIKEQNTDDKITQKIKKIREIEELGSEVHIFRGDISDLNQMERILEQLKQSFSEINGVIHSAGVLKDSLITNVDQESFLSVLRPKVLGTWILDHVTRKENLDFFILFSGFISFFGNTGQINHCAANCFEDAFAYYRYHIKKKLTLCINWGIWEETGIVGKSNFTDPLREIGLNSIKTRDGLFAFEEALKCGYLQVGIAPVDKKLEERLGILQQTPIRSEITFASSKPNEVSQAKILIKKYPINNPLENKISQLIINLIKSMDILKDTTVSPKDSFLELGLDSLTLVTLTQQFEKQYHLELYPTVFFEYPTIKRLSEYLADEYELTFSKIFSEQSEEFSRKGVVLPPPECISRIKGHGNNKIQPIVVETKISDFSGIQDKDIAIIGMSGIFPGANNISEFWSNLINGVDNIREIPLERWDINEYYLPKKVPGKSYCKWAGLVDKIDQFDPLFFNISPNEAMAMDPQQRLFLMETYKALENAGYTGEKIDGTKTGVFVGISKNDFEFMFFDPSNIYSGMATSDAIVANRVSHIMNLKGPSVTINTLCSSSMVAIHMACQSILTGESDYAIAGGAHCVISPEYYVLLSKMEALSEDGKCKAFDKKANGFVSGEGAGVIILKKLKDAVRDHDHIYAVIKSTSINHDGHTGSLSAPNAKSQADVIKLAIHQSNVDPNTITYIETHGTGTALGDPIEIKGLTDAFEDFTSKKGFCGLGSVKTNIGHLDAAAGITGVIKTVLALGHHQLPPNLNFNQLNSYIDLNSSPFYLIDKIKRWESFEHPLRAGVSSFGMGGTNAHLILEEAPAEEKLLNKADRPYHILALSGKSEKSLHQIVNNLKNHIESNYHLDIWDICYTLNTGRKHFDFRVAFVIDDLERIFDKLNNFGENRVNTETSFNSAILSWSNKQNKSKTKSLVPLELSMFFPDLTKYVDRLNWKFAKELYKNQPVFKGAVDECLVLLRRNSDKKTWPDDFRTHQGKTVLFSLQYALAELWMNWGISPQKFLGQGLGLHVARVLNREMDIEQAFSLIFNSQESNAVVECNFPLDDKPSIVFNIGPEEASNLNDKIKSDSCQHSIIHLFNGVDLQWKSMFSALGLLYIHGLDINWENIEKNFEYRKVPLPTYPFETRGYWPKSRIKSLKRSQAQTVDPDCFLHSYWEESPLVLSPDKTLEGVWVLFSDELGLTNELTKSIESFILVKRGECFRQTEDGNFQINPLKEDNYVLLFKSIKNRNIKISGLIHLWTFSQFVDNLKNLSSLKKSLYDGIYSLFFIAKAIMPRNNPFRLVVVSSFANSLPEDTDLHSVEKSPLSILLNVLYREEKKLITLTVDINPDTEFLKEIGENVIHEIKIEPAFSEVAYRGNKRYLKCIKSLSLEGHNLPKEVWKSKGVYIITGGLSGIGAEISQYLATNFSAGLVIIGRTPLPSQATPEDSPEIAQKICLIRLLREAGSKVLYYALDISQKYELSKALRQAKEEFGHFSGVLHCAGVNDDKLLINKSFDSFKKVLSPKICGAFLLVELLSNESLDFFVSFSSIAAILGTPGQGDYSVANSFMDNYMLNLSKKSNSINYISINWSYWQEGGMKPSERILRKMEKDGILSINSQLGISALEKILAEKKHGNVVVLPLKDKIKYLNRLKPMVMKDSLDFPSTKLSVKDLNHRDNQVKEDLLARTEANLLKIFGEILALEPSELDRDVNLENYGMDSLAVKNALFKLERHYGQYLKPSLFFLYSSIRSLAQHFVDMHNQQSVPDAETLNKIYIKTNADSNLMDPPVKDEEVVQDSGTKARQYREIFHSLSIGEISMSDAKGQLLSVNGEK